MEQQSTKPRRVHDDALSGEVVEILVGAFHEDPLWSWALPDAAERPAQLRAIWEAAVEGALRYPWVWLTPDGSATSVWIPPGGTELTKEAESHFEEFLVDLLGEGANRVLAIGEAMDRARPDSTPHFYLSLLGTAPSRVGHGLGLGLLAENLRLIDELGSPAYLEASNVANVPLYARYGFEVMGSFELAGGAPRFVTMWREPSAGGTASKTSDGVSHL
jgi:GNAT superfamily N-acetyltransferase